MFGCGDIILWQGDGVGFHHRDGDGDGDHHMVCLAVGILLFGKVIFGFVFKMNRTLKKIISNSLKF